MRILITGGAGFIGHHVVQRLMMGHDIVVLDRLDESGNMKRLADIQYNGKWLFHDLRAPLNEQVRAQLGQVDAIIHMAAATHVDRSITDPMSFVLDNVVGTANLLDYAVDLDVSPLFIHFSTDEVFGPAPPGVAYKEDDRYRSGNPYAASKAGAEELVVAYNNTYGLPAIVTHTMNVIGYRQNPEKFFPNTIKKVMNGEEVVIHANADRTKAGSRFYIHASVVADVVAFLLERGDFKACAKYNIVGSEEIDNLELATRIYESCACFVDNLTFNYTMVDFHSSRPGHDLRYALDGTKLASMGYEVPLVLSIKGLVKWYLDNPEWLLP